MATDRVAFLERVTNNYVQGIDFDSQIMEDMLKYVSWIIALATAGLGVIIINGHEIMEHSWIASSPTKRLLLVVAALCFLLSLALGATFQIHTYKAFEAKRVKKTWYLRQELYLLSDTTGKTALPTAADMANVKQLTPAEQSEFAALGSTDSELSNVPGVQQGLAALGYVVLLVVAFS